MKRLQIVMIVLLSVLMLSACAVLGIFLTRGIPSGADLQNYSLVQEKKVPAEGIQSLKIDYGKNSTDVVFYQGTGEEVVMREYMNFKPDKNQLSSVELKNGELVIRGARRNLFSFFGINVQGVQGAYTEIYLPPDLAQGLEALTVKTVSGEVSSKVEMRIQESFTVTTTSGDVLFSKVQAGKMQTSSTSGDIWFPEIQAENAGISSTSGSVRLDSASAAAVDISTTSGDITVDQAEGSVKITSTSGEIRLSGLNGPCQISTTSGDISLGQVSGAVSLSTTSGNVRLDEGQSGLEAESTSGDIQVRSLQGDFGMETTSGELVISDGKGAGTAHSISGDVQIFLEELSGDLDISTTSGTVDLKLPKAADFDFRFSTTSGECNSFFDQVLSFDGKRRNAQGQYGSGGHWVKVSTVSGDLSIREF